MRVPAFGSLAVVAAALVLLVCLVATVKKSVTPLASVSLADGRIFQVEGVSYGTNHVIGSESPLVERLGPWMPSWIRALLASKRPRSDIKLDRPGLVVWINALSAATGKHVDCQGVRVEFIDQNGDCFGAETSSWFGGTDFWRQGHSFHAFPRTQRQLTLQITPWRTGPAVFVRFANPHLMEPAKWSGQPPPLQQHISDFDLSLTGLTLRTNGGPEKYWESPSRMWVPTFELTKKGQRVLDWEEPEWVAEDPAGNRSQTLGARQPVLRFLATLYPNATNTQAAVVVAQAPPMQVSQLQSNVFWNLKQQFGSNELVMLGIFPPGMHIFSQGSYQTNPPVRMAPTQGGSPSGWVGQSQRVTPFHVQEWNGHYTPKPVLYLRAPASNVDTRLGVRLRDEHGRLWLTTREPQGAHDSIWPFLIDLPPDAQEVTAEVVTLKPLRASFDVRTTQPSSKRPNRWQGE